MPYDPRITPEVRAKAREALGRLFSEPPLTGGVFSTGDMFERARAHQDAIINAILAEVVGPERHRFGSPPEPVVNPSVAWCDAYASWYQQDLG